MNDPILKPEVIGALWKREGSYAAVAAFLQRAGLLNPNTGRPYSRSSIARAVRLSNARRHLEEPAAQARKVIATIEANLKPKVRPGKRKKK